jgi:N-acyl-D-amino-acid deacylase
MCDYVIKNVRIADGTGKEIYFGEVGITGDVVDYVNNCNTNPCHTKYTCIIDGKGMLLLPGIIDIHCHSEGIVFHSQKNPRRVMNGITTEIAGNCGTSAAPSAKIT